MIDLPDYKIMTDETWDKFLYLALRVNIDRLPQMKGKGRTHDASKIDDAVHNLARSIRENWQASRIVVLQPPPAENHAPEDWLGPPTS